MFLIMGNVGFISSTVVTENVPNFQNQVQHVASSGHSQRPASRVVMLRQVQAVVRVQSSVLADGVEEERSTVINMTFSLTFSLTLRGWRGMFFWGTMASRPAAGSSAPHAALPPVQDVIAGTLMSRTTLFGRCLRHLRPEDFAPSS